MPTYLHKLYGMLAEGREYVSCTVLADYINIELIVVRKDIALTGLAGHRRRGYKINELIQAIRKYIGWDRTHPAALIGAGALGSALLGYQYFPLYGLRIDTVFDSDPAKIGQEIHGHKVLDIASFRKTTENAPPEIGIICVPGSSAQETADIMITGGIKYIWNFANVSLRVPGNVIIQREVIAGGFALLAAKIKRIETGDGGAFED